MMGMTSEYLREAKRGMAAVEQRISYRREALVGDIILVRSAMLELRPKSVRFVHEMYRGDGGDHLATMMVTGVHLDLAVRKSTQFEPQIFAPLAGPAGSAAGALGRVAAEGLIWPDRAAKKKPRRVPWERAAAADWRVPLPASELYSVQRAPIANCRLISVVPKFVSVGVPTSAKW